MLLELQNTVLRMIARGEGLHATMDRLCLEVEALAPGVVCSLLTHDEDGTMHPLASPSLPQAYSRALDGLVAGPNVGSCGSAAFLGKPVAVTDIEADARWADFKHLPLPLGLLACWSSPILDKNGRVIATFAFYFTERRGPTTLEKALVQGCLPVCTIAMELHETLLEQERQARTDPLTGLPNRAGFDRDLGGEMPGDWAMLLIDVDHLKTVNDTFGHLAGDALIKAVGIRVAQSAAPHRAYRLGGDEFAVIVRSGSPEELELVGSRIVATVREAANCNGHAVFPTVTIGGAVHGSSGPEATRQNADFALYHAKETRRGSVVVYDPALGTAITERVDAVRMVARALDENRVEAYYQPIVRLDTREIVGVEALCRVRATDGSIIPASDFHEATKDAHVAGLLTRRMVAQVARDVAHWLSKGIPFQHVGINVSAADFQGGGLSSLLHNEFSASHVDLKHVILEVTESVYLGHRDQSVANEIRALREAGLKVALDDFGTGFASLTHLLSVPVDIIKIDRSFVARLSPGDVGAAVVDGILHIARNLGMRVVAEGIETVAQATTLQEMGCILGQGYLYSRPASMEDATRLLLERSQGMARPLKATA